MIFVFQYCVRQVCLLRLSDSGELMQCTNGACSMSSIFGGMTLSEIMMPATLVNNFHFLPLSYRDISHCLGTCLLWMGRQMRTKYSLSPHQKPGEDLRGNYTPSGSKFSLMISPPFTWSCWGQDIPYSSESIFFEAAGFV